MAESLCNNPKALITPRGLTLEKPCGFWEAEGLGWCNRKDYNDWLAAYKIRIDVAGAQMKDLKKARKDKSFPLTEEELMAEAAITEHKNLFKALQEAAYKDEGDLSSQDYDKKIKAVQTQTADLLCIIENTIQSGIESMDVDIKPTGLIEGSRNTTSVGTYIGYGVGAVAAYWLYTRLV